MTLILLDQTAHDTDPAVRPVMEPLTYWRALPSYEADFCIDDNLAIEVKASKNITEKHLKVLKALREEDFFKQFIIVCREEHP